MSDQDTSTEQSSEPQDVFAEETPQKAQQETPSDQPVRSEAQDPYREFLEAIKNEEGAPKYKTVSEALMGAAHGQQHIQRLEAELAELRDAVGAQEDQASVREAIQEALNSRQQDDRPAPGEDVEAVFNRLYNNRTQEEVRARNRGMANEAMAQKFGEKAREVTEAKARELGLSVDFFRSIAERSPNAFLEYFNSTPTGTPATPPPAQRSNVTPRTEGDLTPPENIMAGASTRDLVDYWRRVADSVQ